MRRPVMYLAGLLMATGASLALAGPAAAAPAHSDYHHNHSRVWLNDDDDFFLYNHQDSFNNGNHFNGINLLNGAFAGGGLL